jgi:hypothetical protein
MFRLGTSTRRPSALRPALMAMQSSPVSKVLPVMTTSVHDSGSQPSLSGLWPGRLPLPGSGAALHDPAQARPPCHGSPAVGARRSAAVACGAAARACALAANIVHAISAAESNESLRPPDSTMPASCGSADDGCRVAPTGRQTFSAKIT